MMRGNGQSQRAARQRQRPLDVITLSPIGDVWQCRRSATAPSETMALGGVAVRPVTPWAGDAMAAFAAARALAGAPAGAGRRPGRRPGRRRFGRRPLRRVGFGR